ncbi:MAG: hypothetical protein HN413_01025 [Chloroflexi bacterium]|jgi:hypothetical protein|nr:hypothetical protein [Chloroflexota bacterium]
MKDNMIVYDTEMPNWVRGLAEIDAIDTIMVMVGYPFSYAAGGISGLVLWSGAIASVTVLRKTPILPATGRLIYNLINQPDILIGEFRDVVLPVLREDPPNNVQPPAPAPRPTSVNDTHPIHVQPQTEAHIESVYARDMAAQTVSFEPVNSVRALTQAYKRLNELPALPGRHVAIFGPTDSGKSTIIKIMVRHHQDAVVIIGDPHYEPGNWPSRAYVVGAGRNFGEIASTVDALVTEMARRYAAAARGELVLQDAQTIYFVTDELSAIASNEPDVMIGITALAQEGRKARIFVIITPHGEQVSAMGLEGKGQVRENFAFIAARSVPDNLKRLPRIVKVTLGPPKNKASQNLGYFVVPPPPVYTGTPYFGLPQFLLERVPELEKGVPEHVPDKAQRVPECVPENGFQRVPDAGHTPGTGFSTRFGRDSDATHSLAAYLAQYGFGIRKIANFLPFANDDARQIANLALAERTELPKRPDPGSSDEIDLVRYLHVECGAPIERIASLLNGNKWENLARIQNYGKDGK